MLSKAKSFVKVVVPSPIRSRFRSLVNKVVTPVHPLILSNPYVTGKFYPLYPLEGHPDGHIIPKPDTRIVFSEEDPPLPPVDLLQGYSPEEHLTYGHKDMTTMLDILTRAGVSWQALTRVLDFGCASGRMLRFYPHKSGRSEVWGVDIEAEYITWCQHHLSPPFLFAMATTSPHLPFEDNYFDLIYSGSVFTHISELADTWLLELRRILRRGGYAYITIHDKRTVELLSNNKDLNYELYEMVRQFDEHTSVCSRNYAYFSIGADPHSQVFYDREYLVQKWSKFAKVVSVTPEAYRYQTAILLQKSS